MMRQGPAAPFKIVGLLDRRWPLGLRRALGAVADRVLAFDRLDRIYQGLPQTEQPAQFVDAAIDRLGVRTELLGGGLGAIPRSGPLVIVANHPFGGLDGLLLAQLLLQRRPDVRVLVNRYLARIPELQDLFISVDVFGGRKAARENASGLRRALRWVEQGGALAMFPAGEVSHLRFPRGGVVDPLWPAAAGRLVRKSGAAVLPVYFHGANSWAFQLSGLVHPMLRTALLPRELLNKSRHAVRIGIGNVIDVARLAATADDAALASRLRLQTHSLVEKVAAPPRVAPLQPRPMRPIAAAQSADLLAAEVARLPAHQRLAGAGDLSVLVTSARLAPRVLQEIGRLRELTFRAVGEGTGKSADIDLFDDYYQHLFLWHEGKKEIAGAYRLGATDRIVRKLGVRGFYTNTLFGFRKTFIDRVDPGLELGRSFVRAEYQKSFAPLLLLWKGIAEYVVRNPRYAVLFGAVSISNDYRPLSRDFLVNFLTREHFDPSLGRLIKARHPVDRSLSMKSLIDSWPGPHNLEALAALVSGLEPDGKGVPVLVRQYLKLGGKIVSFNVDPDFSDSIDCCIVVDLRKTDPRVLEKYMGKAGAAAFLSEHCLGSATQQVS